MFLYALNIVLKRTRWLKRWMEHYIAIYESGASTLGAATRRVAEGVFSKAADIDCPYLIDSHTPITPELFQSGFCVGMIGFLWHPPEAIRHRHHDFSMVNLSNSGGPIQGMGNVLSDDRAVGRMAAEYLLKLGHRDFLGVGQSKRLFSEERLEGFATAVKSAGGTAALVNVSGKMPRDRWSPGGYQETMWEELEPVLGTLPSRCGIFAVSDWLAWPILRQLEHKLPERQHTTAILGVDNSSNRYFDPRRTAGLSSVLPGFRQMGAVALEELLHHQNDPDRLAELLHRLPPERLIERASTAGPACDDPLTAHIIRLMWSAVRREDDVNLSQLAHRTGMSPRTLEKKFNRHVGQSAREFLCQQRIDYGKNLLRETPLPIAEISARCGYADTPAFSNAFKRLTGSFPRAWRRRQTFRQELRPPAGVSARGPDTRRTDKATSKNKN